MVLGKVETPLEPIAPVEGPLLGVFCYDVTDCPRSGSAPGECQAVPILYRFLCKATGQNRLDRRPRANAPRGRLASNRMEISVFPLYLEGTYTPYTGPIRVQERGSPLLRVNTPPSLQGA